MEPALIGARRALQPACDSQDFDAVSHDCKILGPVLQQMPFPGRDQVGMNTVFTR